MRRRSSPAGPTEQALDQLWSRFDRSWRRLLSPRILEELKLRASFDVELFSPRQIANEVPRGTVPDCASCEDICCVGIENLVSLRLVDVAVLIDIDRTDLMTKVKPAFSDELLRRRPALGELVASELFRTLPVLRQLGDSRICAALTPELSCSLHPHWPTSCERFPYTLSAARKTVGWGTRCPSRRRSAEDARRSDEIFEAAISSYNERVRDAVLLAHAREDLEALGLGAWLVGAGEEAFEPLPKPRLPVL